MKGHQRNLDAKTDQQGTEQQQLTAHRQTVAEHRREAEVNGAGQQRQTQEGPQNQHARNGGEDQELGGGIGPVDPSPD